MQGRWLTRGGRPPLALSAVCVFSLCSSGCSFLLDFDELKGGAPPNASAEDTDPDDTDDVETGATDETGATEETEQTEETEESDGTEVTEETDVDLDASLPDAAVPCSEGCDDQDPCTVDSCVDGICDNQPLVCQPSDICMEAVCVEGNCVETPRQGLVEDGYDETVDADDIYRSELVSAEGRFYRATYGDWDGTADVRVATFDLRTPQPIAEFSFAAALDSSWEIISPAALVPDTRFGLELNVYVAVRPANEGANAAGSIARIRLDQDLNLIDDTAALVTTTPNYRFVSNRLGPAAGQATSGEPYVVWGGCTTTGTGVNLDCVATEPEDGAAGIYFQVGDDGLDPNAPGDNFLREPGTLSGLASITSGTLPGAVWMTNASSGIQLRHGFNDGFAPQALAQCDDESGFVGYGLNVSLSLTNLWTASWTKRMGSNFRSELVALQCLDNTCVDTLVQSTGCPSPLPAGRVQDDSRALIARSLDRPDDAPGRVYQTFAHASSSDDGAELSLIVNRVDFGSDNSSPDSDDRRPQNLDDRTLATSQSDSAPDWPGLATFPPDRLAVSWIEPDQDADGDRLRVQRYRICYGD